jgi:hypothetical protein
VLKTYGYLVSTVSVLLLGIVSWKSASEQPLLALCLIGGMVTSITGMFLRWLSHEADRRRKKGAVDQLASTSEPSGTRIANRNPSGANSNSVVARRS